MAAVETTTQSGVWSIDPVHSNVAFEVEYAGAGTFRGGFREFSGALEGGTITGSAPVASVDVKDEQLNGHLLSPEFFDAERHPEITFRGDKLLTGDDGNVETNGELTIKGVTRPVVLKGRIGTPNVDPFGREKVGLNLETTIDRTQFGVDWNAPNQGGGDYLGNEVKLIAELILVREEA